MEGNRENMKKKNMSIKIVSGGGGGLAGIILLGGAIATAALVSTFAYKRNHRSKSKKINQPDEDHEGLSFLVPDSLSPHHPSNGTQSELVYKQIMILDETSEIIGEKDKEIDIPENGMKSSTSKEEFLAPVADRTLLLKPEEMKKNDTLEETVVSKVDEEIMTVDSNKAVVVDNDRQIPLNIEDDEEEDEVCDGIGENVDGNNKQLVEAAQADQLGVVGKERMPVEECNENKEVIIERNEVLVVAALSQQPGVDDDHHKPGKCDANVQILVEKREEPVEAAVVDEIRVDVNPHKGGEECDDDAGNTIEKGEELIVEVVAANGIQLSEELEAKTMYGDQDFFCSDGIIINRNESEACDLKKPDLLLPGIDSSSLLKPAGNDLVEDPLGTEDTTILEGNEANEAAAQEDHIKVEGRAQKQLVEANGDNEEDYKIYREITNVKCEEADEIAVEKDQQMQPCEESQKKLINEDQEKYSSDKSCNLFQSNGFEIQEFSFPSLDSPSLFKSGKLNTSDSSVTALHTEDVNLMEKDRSAVEVFAYQIMLEKKPLVQSAENDEMKSCDDCSENDVAEGEETLETGNVDIAQQIELSERYKSKDDSKNDEEAFEIIQTENFEVENNLQSPLEENNHYEYNVNKEEDSDTDCAEEEEDEDEDEEENSHSDCDEEDTVDEVEESSETTGESSLESNAEAIWPVQEFSQKVKNIQDSNSYVRFNSHKLEDDDRENFPMGFSKLLTAELTTLKQPTNFFNLKYWVLSLLLPFLLLLWLLSSQLSSPGSSHCHLE